MAEPHAAPATAGTTADAPKDKTTLKKSHIVRMLSYLNATKRRFAAWKASHAPLRPVLEVSEYARIEKALSRHGRSTQSEHLRIPMDLMMNVFSFIPRATPLEFKPGRAERPRLVNKKPWPVLSTQFVKVAPMKVGDGTSGAPIVAKLLQCCTMTMFMILENEYMMKPESAPSELSEDDRAAMTQRFREEEAKIDQQWREENAEALALIAQREGGGAGSRSSSPCSDEEGSSRRSSITYTSSNESIKRRARRLAEVGSGSDCSDRIVCVGPARPDDDDDSSWASEEDEDC